MSVSRSVSWAWAVLVRTGLRSFSCWRTASSFSGVSSSAIGLTGPGACEFLEDFLGAGPVLAVETGLEPGFEAGADGHQVDHRVAERVEPGLQCDGQRLRVERGDGALGLVVAGHQRELDHRLGTAGQEPEHEQAVGEARVERDPPGAVGRADVVVLAVGEPAGGQHVTGGGRAVGEGDEPEPGRALAGFHPERGQRRLLNDLARQRVAVDADHRAPRPRPLRRLDPHERVGDRPHERLLLSLPGDDPQRLEDRARDDHPADRARRGERGAADGQGDVLAEPLADLCIR